MRNARMTSRALRTLALIAAIALVATPQAAMAVDLDGEAAVSYTHSTNLFNDHNRAQDTYITPSLSLDWAPLPYLQGNTNISRAIYDSLDGMSNWNGGFGLTCIPTREDATYRVYLKGNYSRQIYSSDADTIVFVSVVRPDDTTITVTSFDDFSTSSFDFSAAVGRNLSGTTSLRAGVSWALTDYLRADSVFEADASSVIDDKTTIDFFIGSNTTLSESVSLDFEAGLTQISYDEFVPLDVDTIPGFPDPEIDTVAAKGMDNRKVRSIYVSPRLSASIGRKTGVSLTAHWRDFVKGGDLAIMGATTGSMSPLANVFEGWDVSLSVKSYLIPNIITSCGIGYWDKSYVKSAEGQADLSQATPRDDKQTKTFVSFKRPLKWLGLDLEPSLSYEYTDNSSSAFSSIYGIVTELYDYSGYTLTANIKARF